VTLAAIEQRHKPEIHVLLHVAVEEAALGLISGEVDRHLLEWGPAHRRWLPPMFSGFSRSSWILWI
jgi:hypothetical protein